MPVFRGLPEPDCVVFQRLPPHEQHILVGLLQASLEFMPQVARYTGDDGLRFGERGFEGSLFARSNVQDRHFEDGISHGYTP